VPDEYAGGIHNKEFAVLYAFKMPHPGITAALLLDLLDDAGIGGIRE